MTELGRNYETESLGGGRFRSTISLKPIAYQKNGVYRRITNQLAASDDIDFPTGVDELCQFRLDAKIAGKSPLFSFGKGQSRVTLTLLGANNGKGTVSGNSVLFPNAWDNADLKLTMAGHRLQKDIFLKTGHPTKFQFRINEHVGFDPKTLQFGNDFRILQPMLHPPANMLAAETMDAPLKWDVAQQSGGKWILTVTLPEGDWAGWTLDPTLTLQPNVADGIDTYIISSVPNTNYGTYLAMYIDPGNSGLLKFNVTPIPAGSTITSAIMSLWSWIPNVSTRSFGLYSILPANSAWTELGATWNYAVATTVPWAGAAGCSLSGTDFNAALMGTLTYIANNPAGTEHQAALNTALVQGWLTANQGCILRDGGGGGQYWFSSDCTGVGFPAAYRPKLVVDYTVAGGDAPFNRIFAPAFRGVFGK